MSNERKPRELKMLHARGFDYRRRIPAVTLGGVWLKECGFEPGDKVSVERTDDGKIILTKKESAQ